MDTDKTKDSCKEKLLQWHPAFFASIQIEFANEAGRLIFESEHTLSTKPLLIDVIIIKKNSNDQIQKNIGHIFKKYNIIEYKSPTDYLSIDDFYKVYGYTCFYKSSASTQNRIPADELTITFVCKNYPHKFVNHLIDSRRMTVKQFEAGIYYLYGDIFPIQLIITSQLSPDNNLWLKSLTNDLRSYEIIEKISEEYRMHKRDDLYKSAMNIIIRANNQQFKEASTMCEAILELFKDEYEIGVAKETAKAKAEGIDIGIDMCIESTIKSCKALSSTRERTLSMLAENFNLPKERIEIYMKKYW